jgi:hypothetical protein
MKRFFIYILTILCFSNYLKTHDLDLTQNNKTDDNFGPAVDIDFLAPVKFTQVGIQDFLKNIYDNPKYAREIFPNNMSHFIQFLDFGIKTDQSLEFLEQVIRLFRQKVMCTEYMCSQEIARVSDRLISLLEGFKITNKLDNKNHEQTVKETCYNMFLSDFDRFKLNPDAFLTDLSKEICKALQNSTLCSKETTSKQIQNLVTRFMETTLSKVLWSPTDGKNAWEEFKVLGESVAALHQRKIIPAQDDLNDLIKIIVERFNYFLNIAGADMPIEFYEVARADLSENKLPWLYVEELEKDITSKADSLRKCLMQGQIKAQAKSVYGLGTTE